MVKQFGVWRKWNNSAEPMFNHFENYDTFDDAEAAARSCYYVGETCCAYVVDNHDSSSDPLLILSFDEFGNVKSYGTRAPPSESWSYRDFIGRIRDAFGTITVGDYASPFVRKHLETAREEGKVYWRGLATEIDNSRLKKLRTKRTKDGYVFCYDYEVDP